MKITSFVLIAILILVIGYLVYFAIGMSSTYPHLKDYAFGVNRDSFERELTAKINRSKGWLLQKKDSTRGNNEACYRAWVFYNTDSQKLEYRIIYCFDSAARGVSGDCASVGVTGAFDYVNKLGGYKLSDKGVENLVQKLDHLILNDLAPPCVDHP